MMEAVRELYGRVPPFVRVLPFIAAIPFAAELIQHAAEIRLGMYATGALGPEAEKVRLMFGAVKILSIFLIYVLALRWWAFDGDLRRAARPSWALAKGFGIVLIVELGGESLLLGGAALLARAVGAGAPVAIGAALLLWQFLATLLIPWFAGLLTEDRTMTLRRSVRAIRGRMGGTFALFLAAYLPAMFVHYALGYGAIGRPGGVVWAMMVVDAAVVALLTLLLGSAFFTIYRRAAERSAAPAEEAVLAA